MDPVRELPYWPAAVALLIEAGQMTASDYVPTYPDLPLASEGASTDAKQRRAHFETFRLASLVPASDRSLVRSHTERLNARKGR